LTKPQRVNPQTNKPSGLHVSRANIFTFLKRSNNK
jgi:hypothetical protein